MNTPTYNEMLDDLKRFTVEQHCNRYDDYSENNVDVWGSKSALEELVDELNSNYNLRISKMDIQEVGSECLLRFTVYEDF